jgi:2-iminobutanoate/2-iminopropanoate deaminase
MIERITPSGVPAPRGPYSPAVRAGGFIYIAGQVPVDPASNQPVDGDVQQQTRRVLTNVTQILEACGATLADVVKCQVYLIDAADFKPMNEVYAEFFGDAKPARTTVIVAALPLASAKVEIDAVAYK